MVLRSASLVFVFLLACGDDVMEPDGGPADSGVADSGSLVSPVAAPSLPDFSSCPPGWRTVMVTDIEGLEVCEPWPESGPADCPPHEAHFPGRPGCERVGTPCPADGWPLDLPPTGVVFVRPGATGGDGSRAAPLATLQEGFDAVADGGVIALGTGTYDGRVEIDRPVSILGACTEGVILTHEGSVSGTGIITIANTGPVDIANLTVRSTRDHLIFVDDGVVSIRSVSLDGSGVVHSGGSIVIDEVVARDFRDGTFAQLNINGVASASISRLSIRGSTAGGMTISSAESTDMSDVSVRESGFIALQVTGETAQLARVVVEDAINGGVIVDATGEVEDVAVRRVARSPLGLALGFFSPVEQNLRRIRVEEAADVGLTLGFGGGTAEDVVVLGPGGDGEDRGRGIEIAAGAAFVAERVAVFGSADLAILVDGPSSEAHFTDLVVEEVSPAAGGNFGRCLHAQQMAVSTVSRGVFRRCREAAVTASYGGRVTLRDARIERTLPIVCELGCETPRAGIGLVALDREGQIDAERFVISESALAGVQLVEGGEVDLRDGTIEMNPVGINVQVEGYELTRVMSRVVFRDNGVNLDSLELPVPAAMTETSMP